MQSSIFRFELHSVTRKDSETTYVPKGAPPSISSTAMVVSVAQAT